eukprot:353045-Chlamydomonas_euryale.AAC.6
MSMLGGRTRPPELCVLARRASHHLLPCMFRLREQQTHCFDMTVIGRLNQRLPVLDVGARRVFRQCPWWQAIPAASLWPGPACLASALPHGLD